MQDLTPKRGAIMSPRSALAAATPHMALAGVPPTFIKTPQAISFWGNLNHGDCVTAEEAFAKACGTPEVFISEAEAIAWAARHGILEGASLNGVLILMQSDGFADSSFVYDDGSYQSVDWTNAAALQSAISQGPVKLGVAGNQFNTAWDSTGGESGWFATGWTTDTDFDHCVSLCGYGPMSWLAQQLGSQVPAGVDGTQPGYAVFTWNSIGIIDVPSMLAVTSEAWLRQPTTVTNSLQMTPSLTSWTSTSDGLQHVAYVDGSHQVRAVYEPVGKPPWQDDDSLPVPGAIAAQGSLTSWVSSTDNLQHIAYVGSDGHVHELYMHVGMQPWATDDVTSTANAPGAHAGALTSWVSASDDLQHIAYVGTDGHVHELYMHVGGPSPWATDDASSLANAPTAQNGALTSWVSATDNLQHIAYVGSDGHVHELYMHVGVQPWATDDVTSTANAPAAQAGALTSWVSATDNLQHIAYVGGDGHVHELYMHVGGPSPWATDDASSPANAPAAQGGALTSWVSATDNLQHIAYVGTDGHVHELYMRVGVQPWATDDVSSIASAPAAQAGSLTSWVSTADNVQHIAYVGTDGHGYELFMPVGRQPWKFQKLQPSTVVPGQWSGWSSLGGVLTSDPSVASNADGRLEVFAKGTDNALWHNWQVAPNGTWSGWSSLGGVLAGGACVGRNQDGRLEAFARGTDHELCHIWQLSSGGWSSWASLGGNLTADPVVASNADGRLEVFVTQPDGAVWHIWQVTPGGAWSTLASLGGTPAGAVCLARDLDGRLEAFVRWTDNAIWHDYQVTPGGAWSGWASIGGTLTSDPAVGSNSDGRLEVFARGSDNALSHSWQPVPGASGWSGWESLHGFHPLPASKVSVGRNVDGRLQVFGRETDDSLWTLWQTPDGTWAGWAGLGGVLPGNVAVGSNADGRLEIFTRGTDNALWHDYQVTAGAADTTPTTEMPQTVPTP